MLIVLLVLAGCGGDDPAPATSAGAAPVVAETGASVERPLIDDAPAMIATPQDADDRAVIFVHGAGQNELSLMEGRRANLAARLLEEGFAVAASDAGGDAWGNPASLQDYEALRAELARRGFTRSFVLAEPMGGLAGLALAVPAEAFVGIYPVCNLASMIARGGYAQSIRAAYGGEPPATLSPVIPQGVRGERMVFWASPADTVVAKAENTDICAAMARQGGARVTVVETTATTATRRTSMRTRSWRRSGDRRRWAGRGRVSLGRFQAKADSGHRPQVCLSGRHKSGARWAARSRPGH